MTRAALQLVRSLLLSLAVVAPLRAAPATAPADGTGYVAIALHDVVDSPTQLDEDSVTSDRLVVLLEWLAGNGWTAVSLDDIERAGRGIAPLPPKAVLITVDDGLASLYTRVYPLAMAYRMPVVAAVVGEWMDVPADGTVRYGERTLPRAAFISWEQAREMQASGWVEFASHSQALHTVVQANPQGNLLPAAQNLRWADGRYESTDAFRARISADLARSRERMQAELGRAPRAIVWPYGRYNEDALEMARQTGFAMALTLEPGVADASRPWAIPRFLPTGDPVLATWVDNLRLHDPWPAARRIVAVDTAQLVGRDAADTDARLGVAIERLLALGATHVMLDAGVLSSDGRLQQAWFANAQVPVREDVLGRFAAQMRARAGVEVIVRIPHVAVLARVGDRPHALALYRELAAHVPFEGLVLEDVPSLGTVVADPDDPPWQVARLRESARTAGWPEDDVTALQAFLVAARMRPGMQAYWLAPDGQPLDRASGLTEVTLVPRSLDAPDSVPGVLTRRIGIFLRTPDGMDRADALARTARAFQVAGGTVIGWGPDDTLAGPHAANVRVLAPVLSARRLHQPQGATP
ncbi:MAG: poly-beta-1,6-N-acetyl-D-glucosamine N-deacetylase PgaB [Pseudoxanthomonas sp.]|nr:poly-beta-1,6-N-acetyl-D-glucosamine N-deacetylase PgaB [Pseudoxanthomonas sp.]